MEACLPRENAVLSRETQIENSLARFGLYRWWRRILVGSVDHEAVVDRIIDESGLSARYLFMTMMSAGIAVLGLLLSSPAVVIGAMLISPLMSPILGLGFSLALFDFAEMRRALIALAAGSACAVFFTALIVAMSPLQAPTSEIIARTRPNLFDLAVALFAALAGTFAIIRGRGDTVVGVAIATALMPPLAVVGYGMATDNLPVLGGAFALFITNFVTIALSATVMARFYGFGHSLSSQQTWTQTIVLALVFIGMAIPLGFSLKQIATEAVTTTQVRSFLSDKFGTGARVTQLDVDYDSDPIRVRAVVITPRARMQRSPVVQAELRKQLDRDLRLQLDQVVLEAGAGAIEAQREELRQAGDLASAETARLSELTRLLAVTAGTSPAAVTIDREHRRAVASAVRMPGANLATYRALEQRARADVQGWDIILVPPQVELPIVTFGNGNDSLEGAGRDAVLLSAWAASRWNMRAVNVPGLAVPSPERPSLLQRRAAAIAALLGEQGIATVPGPPPAGPYRLGPPTS